jgi:GR25 family glycosyltransferase involved in LPS biosynthesis
MDGVDIIYWINLDRSTERRSTMTRLFQDEVFNNIPIERVSAVDGNNTKAVYPRLNFMYKQKNDYEYACMLSHLDTIRKFSRSDLPVALIMEDDITMEFKKYWRKSVREIMANAPADWEIIQLCYITQNNLNHFNLYERNLHNKTVSAAAYLIKNSAAKRLINGIYKNGKYELESYIIHHADCYIFNKTVTYTYKYPFFIYKTGNDSLLHPQDLKDHERSKMQIVKMYNNLVS